MDCPLRLELPIRRHPESGDQSVKCLEIEDEKECGSARYVLYSAVIHSGKSAEFGHYYTIGRHAEDSIKSLENGGGAERGRWFMFNDRTVSRSSYDALCGVSQFYKSDVPYILFYQRIDDEVESAKEAVDGDFGTKQNAMGKESESEWAKTVRDDNRLFDQEMAKFAASKSTFH